MEKKCVAKTSEEIKEFLKLSQIMFCGEKHHPWDPI